MLKIWSVLVFVLLATVLAAPALGQTTEEDWVDKGTALAEQGKYDDALQAYDKATELSPQSGEIWKKKGNALKALGRTTEADAALAKAKELGYTG